MRKTALFLSGVLVLNTVASAAVASSRVDQVARQAVTQSQHNLQSLKADMLQVDQSLADLEKQIGERRGIVAKSFSGISITAASAGLAVTAMAMLVTRKSSYSGQYGAIFQVMFGMAATAISVLAPLGDMIATDNVDTESLEAELRKMTETLGSIDAGQYPENYMRAELNMKLDESFALLQQLKKSQSKDLKEKLLTQLTQAVGFGMIAYGMADGKYGRQALAYGTIVMSVGNIAALVDGLTESQTDKVLAEIKSTRESIQSAASEI